jgi:RNA polymerase sigma-70 factor (ECF subfamily)
MHGSIVTDAPILQRRQIESDRDARLRTMVGTHFDAVWRTLKRLGVREDRIDDACQRVWIVAASKLESIEPGGERAYLLGIALRIASDARRSARREREVAYDGDCTPASDACDTVPSPDVLLDAKRAREVLSRALDRLTPDLREAFVLFELEELTAPEVARLLGVPEGTVASRVRRAREQIRASLGRLARREP